MVELWADVQKRVRTLLGPAVFNSWLKDVELEQLDGQTVILKVSSNFIADYISINYTEAIKKCFIQAGEKVLQVRFRVKPPVSTRSPEHKKLSLSQEEMKKRNAGLDKHKTFSYFVVGTSNEHAHDAAMHVAKDEKGIVSSLYLYGMVGLGKTHLMKAISWAINERNPGAKIRYMTGESFTSLFVTSSRSGKHREFREVVRTLDVLLIDDIQFIAGKSKTTEELELTFDVLTGNNRKVILTGNSPIDTMKELGARLRSRIQQNLVAKIDEPDLDLRLRILTEKLRLYYFSNPKFALADGVIEFVAERITGDVRRLEGALRRLVASASYLPQPITIIHAEQLLADLLNIETVQPQLEEIINTVAKYYSIKPFDISGKSRVGNIARARQIGIYLANEMTTKSVAQIGKQFARDHTTVSYSINRIRGLCNSRQDIVNDVYAIKRELGKI